MPAFPDDLISQTGVVAARLVALGYLEQSRSALSRLDDPSDADALHDFRVALRRLRSTLRAYPSQLEDSAPRRLRKRVRDLTRATNAGRDAEVQLAWLRTLAGELTSTERVGWSWLVEWIEHAREEAIGETRDRLRRSFERLDRQLEKRLGVYRETVVVERPAPEPTFGVVARAAMLVHAQRLDQLLADIHAADDLATIHRARIAAKRLRYVLEPVRKALPNGPPLVSELKALQDVLGDLCDANQMERTLLRAVEAVGARQARRRFENALAAKPAGAGGGARPRGEMRGLVAVARRLEERRKAGYARLATTWLGGDDVFTARVDAATRHLLASGTVGPVPPPVIAGRVPRRRGAGRPV
jgi:CHAD domain-containing protein